MLATNSPSKKWIKALNFLLLAAMSYVGAQIAWMFVPSDKGYVAPPHTMAFANDTTPSMSIAELTRRINQLYPFGKANKQVVVEQTAPVITAPETKLNYKLRGIYYSTSKPLASAIIEIKNGKSKSLKINDEIEKGITLHDINLNSVVLNRYGKFETLSLEKNKLASRGSSITSTVESVGNSQQSLVLRQYKQRFTNNPMALARRFRAIPVTQGSKNIGFKLQAVGGETLLKKLDVPKDAVFTAINGVSLAKPFQALEALKSLQTAKQVTITFQLNGVEQTRNFKL